ncbi:MAG: class I SAM-dependent methyltransferase [Anaerolineales bacterium]|nr:class I SAM-dependent methyltransferase [Anaerolineales bacterium]
MFSKSAKFYNALYGSMGKDYAAEAQKVHLIIQQHKKLPGNALLEVACGTGLHASILQKNYQVEGLDLDAEMLAVASQNYPDIPFHQADMAEFDLGKQFDAVTCLFSSIGYVKTKARLNQAIQTMAEHLLPGGVLILEPWFTPEQWKPGRVSALFVDQPDLKISRMNISEVEGRLSFFVFHYTVGTPQGIETFTERHELGLFTREEYLEAFYKAGLEVIHDPEGLDGRGLYIGLKS